MTNPLVEKIALVRNPDKSFSLVAIVKRTYAFQPAPRPRLALADVQVPLREVPLVELVGQSELVDDGDLVAQKIATDVVVLGHAHAPGGAKETLVSVAVGKMARRLSVIGPRRLEVRPDGTVRFTPTESFTKVKLSPRLAYGGYDAWAQARLDPVPSVLAASLQEPPTGLYGYPRNTLGVGWFVDVDRFRADGALLPQIEDPADPLLADKVFVPAAERWIDAPISASIGWIHYTSYPRMHRMVGSMLHHAPPERPIREAGFPDGSDLLEPWTPSGASVRPRALQGAAPGLATERLSGDELVILEHLHEAAPRIELSLPGEIPIITLRPPDVRPIQPAPVLQTVRIEPDENRISLTFSAAVPLMAPATRSFLERVELAVAWKRR
jgi:hypothetical protein